MIFLIIFTKDKEKSKIAFYKRLLASREVKDDAETGAFAESDYEH